MPKYKDSMFAQRGLKGQFLHDEVHATPIEREPLIEGFLYEKSVLMTSADPGLGKSTIMACAIAQASAGLPVFGFLNVPRPLKFYYVPFERGRQEILERFKLLEQSIPIQYDNIIVNDSFIGMDVTNQIHADEIIRIIKEDTPTGIDVFCGDPMYAAVRGGLSSDEKASIFTAFSSRLVSELNCSNWWNHHNVKQTYDNQGNPITKADSFYGSIWLKAHMTGAYHLSRSSENNGVIMDNKKDSHDNLLKKIILDYDPGSHISTAVNLQDNSIKKDRAMLFIRRCFHEKKQFTFKQFLASVEGVNSRECPRYCRKLIATPPISNALIKHKGSNGMTLHEVIKLI